MKPHKLTTGFTLIEVLAAFAILGVSIIAIYEIWRTGLLRTEANLRRSIAVELAQSLMEERLAFERISQQPRNGIFDGIYEWQVSVAPDVPPAENETFEWELLEVTVQVTWPGPPQQQTLGLRTVTLSDKP